MSEEQATLSVVVPVYAGADYLERLAEAVGAVREAWRAANAPVALGELIFVDDASRDGSSEVIDRLAERHDWVTALHLSRNYGQHAATIAGLLHASGDWIATMDEDLQHRPERLEDLLRAAIEGSADLVYARPDGAVHGTATRDLASKTVKRVMAWLTGDPQFGTYNSFRLIRGEVARAAASVCGHDTYLDVSLSWFTQRVVTLPMTLTDERFQETGRSGYKLSSLIAHGGRLFFSSQIRLLSAAAVFGFGLVALTVLAGAALLVAKLIDPGAIAVRGWTSTMLAIAFFGGTAIAMLGLVLQYLSTVVLRAHGKPTFFVIDRSADAALRTWFARGPVVQAEAPALSLAS